MLSDLALAKEEIKEYEQALNQRKLLVPDD